MTAYYQFISREIQPDNSCIAHYKPTPHAKGAWNDNEQHMAPATGILTKEIIAYSPHDNLRLARLSLDILGVIPFQEFTVTTRCIRPGRTIELIESVLSSGGCDSIVARAWRLCTGDTSEISGLEDQVPSSDPNNLPSWDGMSGWPGGFIESLRLAADPNRREGKGLVWLSNDLDMVEGEETSDVVRLMGLVDTANGVVPRIAPNLDEMQWIFPNTDLQIHMHRLPQGKWLGIEAVQQYGEDGVGLTSAVLHDLQGPFGRSEQILTIRPMPKK